MMDRQVLLVMGSRGCCLPSDPLSAAKSLGCRTAVLFPKTSCETPSPRSTISSNACRSSNSDKLVDCRRFVNLSDADEVVKAAIALHQDRPIHAVMGYDDEVVPLVSKIAASIGLIGNPVETAFATRNKALMKMRLSAAGVPIASYSLTNDEDDAIRWAGHTGYPVVVKPVCGAGSQGVIRADSEPELRDAYRWLCQIAQEHGLNSSDISDTEHLVEKYLDGSEYSVELIARDGNIDPLCVFEKPLPLHGPYFEESIYVTPARITPEREEEMEELAERAAKALDIRNGPIHCELRLSSEGLFVIEIASRLIGGACSRVLPYVFGENMHEHVLNIALGNKQPLPNQRSTAAGAMMIPVPGKGRLISVTGEEAAQKVPGIRDVVINVSPGDVILTYPEQSCYIGMLTATSDTPEEVVKLLSEAADLIQFDIGPLTSCTSERSVCKLS